MREVAIIGVGLTPVGEHWDTSLRKLAADAAGQALADAGGVQPDALYVGNAYGATISSQTQLAALVADYAGLDGIEALGIEAAEASGAAALRAGYLAVASGAVETALVVGAEKMTDSIATTRVAARGVSLDADFESAQGATLTALAAMLMRRYMHEYGLELDVFEGFAINAHANGARSPHAMFRNLIKPGRYAQAPMIADPINLFDSAPDADGAAALVLTARERAADLVPHPVHIAGSAVATDTLALHDRADPLYLKAAAISAQRACQQAGIVPANADLFELHDAFAITSTLSLEAAGLAARGEGWKLAQDGAVNLSGRVPISTFGGLKSRGNPAGAAGAYQAVEACLQLRGAAGENQVPGARIALIQNLGGLGSTAVAHVLRV
jgi:acetyl-CoA C-acetyltransferase